MTSGMEEQWIPRSLDYPHTFLGLLYMASSYDDASHQREVETLETAALRQDIIHYVGEYLTDIVEGTADHNIRAVVHLIAGHIIGGTWAGLAYHVNGLTTMIRQRGGLHQLEPVLASMASLLLLEVGIIGEERPVSMFIDYSTSRSGVKYPTTATVPESPLWCPHGHYVTLQRSVHCIPTTLRLVEDVRHMIDGFLNEVSFNVAMNASFACVLRSPSRQNQGIPVLSVFKHQLKDSLP